MAVEVELVPEESIQQNGRGNSDGHHNDTDDDCWLYRAAGRIDLLVIHHGPPSA